MSTVTIVINNSIVFMNVNIIVIIFIIIVTIAINFPYNPGVIRVSWSAGSWIITRMPSFPDCISHSIRTEAHEKFSGGPQPELLFETAESIIIAWICNLAIAASAVNIQNLADDAYTAIWFGQDFWRPCIYFPQPLNRSSMHHLLELYWSAVRALLLTNVTSWTYRLFYDWLCSQVNQYADIKTTSDDRTVGSLRCSVDKRALGLMRLAPAFRHASDLYITDTSEQKVAVTVVRPDWWPNDLVIE